MRSIFAGTAVALTILALTPAAEAQTYYQYQTQPAYQYQTQPTYRVVPQPAPAQQVQAYPDNLHAALNLLQQAEDQLRAVRLRDNDNRNEAIDKIREARREVEKTIRDNRR